MRLLSNLFTWWRGATFGTTLFTRRFGGEIGRDGDDNVYFQTPGGLRRWVIYAGDNDASRVPPEWHAWLHHQIASAPSEKALPVKRWEQPWVPNLTGTPAAHMPSGALERTGLRARATGDYEAWSPES